MELSSTTTPTSSNTTSTSSSSTASSTASADRKILADLEILLERMRRCEELLREQTHSSALSEVDGQLQSTLVVHTTPALLNVVGFLEASAPRMVELVEVAAMGVAVSEPVLMKCLTVNDKLTKLLSDIDLLPFVESSTESTAAAEAAEDEGAPPAIATTKSEDEFDAFLNDRVSGSNSNNNNTASPDNDGGLL